MKIVSMETPNLHDLCFTTSVYPHYQCWDFRISWICVYNYTYRFIQILCSVSYLSEINMDFNWCKHIPCVSFNLSEHLISFIGRSTGFLYHNVENIIKICINALIELHQVSKYLCMTYNAFYITLGRYVKQFSIFFLIL